MFRERRDWPLTKENQSLTSNRDEASEKTDAAIKKPWQPMKLTYTGEAKDVVRAGGGKTSPAPNDPGEIRKPPGQQ